MLFDGSCVEVFAGLSHNDVARGVLSTRIYRGRSAQPGLAFFAVDGDASVSKVRPAAAGFARAAGRWWQPATMPGTFRPLAAALVACSTQMLGSLVIMPYVDQLHAAGNAVANHTTQIDIREMQQCWADRAEMEDLAAKPCSKCDKPTRPAEKAVDMPYGEVSAGRCKQCLG